MHRFLKPDSLPSNLISGTCWPNNTVLFCTSAPCLLDGNNGGTCCSRKEKILTLFKMVRKTFQHCCSKVTTIEETDRAQL